MPWLIESEHMAIEGREELGADSQGLPHERQVIYTRIL
jgi:hypothetical protein